MNRLSDLVGQKFNSWTVVGVESGKPLCRCECGLVKPVVSYDLRKGKSKMCISCSSKIRGVRHGAARKTDPRYYTFTIWCGIKKRCYDKNFKDWALYGGKGIKVCDRWLSSFENFFEDMGMRPSLKHSIDRIDSSKDYSPENCRWATPQDQARNRPDFNRMIAFQGKTLCLAEWAEITGIDRYTLSCRLLRLNWSVEKTLLTPVRKRKG